MNKQLIITYFEEFKHWLNGGKLQVKFVNKPWEEAPEGIFSFTPINFILVIEDEYVELRKALAEGKTIQMYCKYDGVTPIWDDMSEVIKSIGFVMIKDNYRIKPERHKFKVGDWVIHNGKCKRVTKTIDGYIDSLDNEVAVIMKEESLELWEPKEEEYFWYKNDLVKFDEIKTNCGTLLNSIRGCSYYPAEINFKEYCVPFVGQLPTSIKEYKKD